jgi:surface protein
MDKSKKHRRKKIMLKTQKGITLIALVVTIVVLLILAGVTVSLILDENGIIAKSKDARARWNNAQMNEEKNMGEIDKTVDEIVYNKINPTEMYAVLYSDGTLVFYQKTENILNERNGATIVKQTENISDTQELSEDELKALLFWIGDQEQADQITSVVIAEEIAPKSTKKLFRDLKNIENIIGLNKLNTCNVITMHDMFRNCSNLKSVDLSTFNTEKVTTMYAMFAYCTRIENINMSSFNTKEVTNMSAMFYNCGQLKQLDVNNFNTENVTTMASMFANCSNLEKLDISNWKTANVEDMSWMFAGEDYGNPPNTMNIKQIIGIENLDVSNVKTMDRMFRHCHELTSLDLHKWNVSNVEIMRQMFNSCTSLSKLNIENWNMCNVTNTQYMFNNCYKLNSIITFSFDSTKITTYGGTFEDTAIDSNCLVTVNYTASAAEIIDKIIATKNGNVQKGEQVTN